MNLFGITLRFHLIGNEISDHSLILDIGSGSGSLGSYVPDNSLLVGVEFNEDVMVEARLKVLLTLSDANSLPFRDGVFDAIVLCAVLEHLVDPSKPLVETNRLLKENGKVLIVVPNPQGLHRFIFSFHDEFFSLKKMGDIHYHYGMEKQWRHLFHTIGLKVEKVEGFGGIPLFHYSKIIRRIFRRLFNDFFFICKPLSYNEKRNSRPSRYLNEAK